jgi:murein DD-endopeptidase MepM/ murein hydrolase activator NlpD
MQEGVRLEAPLGSSVRATAAGRVKAVGDSARYGKVVVIDHGQDLESLYGHLGEVLVKEGETVSQGQVIARSGKTGMTAVPQLYFEVREKGIVIDPLTRIKVEPVGREGK